MTTLGNYNHDSEYYIGLYWTPCGFVLGLGLGLGVRG